MKTETIAYRLDTLTMRGYLAYDDSTPAKRPGIILVHEAFGLGEHVKNRARMLADLGYVAFAIDMFGEGEEVTDFNRAIELITDLRGDPGKLRSRAKAGLEVLTALPQVDGSKLGGIGFCFGGTTVLELARDGVDLAGVVSFHGALETKAPAQPGVPTAAIMSCTGADDPMIGPGSIAAFQDEMRHAKADYQIVLYGNTVHSFTNEKADGSMNPALLYNKAADQRSWAAMKAFFNEVFAD